MNTAFRSMSWGLILSMTAAGAAAQESGAAPPAPRSSAQLDAGEPRATTPTSAAAAPGNASAAGSGRNSKPGAPVRGSAGVAQKNAGAADRLSLGTATVTGEREQPKVMYIVPWKNSDIGDPSGKPLNSLLDEALAPVDRDEFRREVAYYEAVKAGAAAKGAAAPAKQGEK